MRIILRKTYGKGQKVFNSKSDMIDYIMESIIYKFNDDYDNDIKCMGLPKYCAKWNIDQLVDYFFGDYERV